MTKDYRADYAGMKFKIKEGTKDPAQGVVVAGAEFEVIGYWDDLNGATSWRQSGGDFAVSHYAYRAGYNMRPSDDEVLYGRIGISVCLVHVTELGEKVE